MNKYPQKKDKPIVASWRDARKAYFSDHYDGLGRRQQIEDTVKSGEYLPYTRYKHTTAGE